MPEFVYSLIYENEYGESMNLMHYNENGGIVVASKTGFMENQIEISMSQGINQIGGTLQGQSVQPRPVTINGEFIRDAKAKRAEILRIVAPTVRGRLIYNNEWYLDGVPTTTPFVESYNYDAKFQFTLMAAYPYWQRLDASRFTLAGFSPLFRFPWNISDPTPFRFSEIKEDLFTTIINNGSIPVPFTLEFRANATLTNPAIINVATLEFIRIGTDTRPYEMEINEIITVSHTNDEITIISRKGDTVTDIFMYVDIDSTFFLLDRGETVIRHDASMNLQNMNAWLTMREAVVGVS